jgi:hypothetical protein
MERGPRFRGDDTSSGVTNLRGDDTSSGVTNLRGDDREGVGGKGGEEFSMQQWSGSQSPGLKPGGSKEIVPDLPVRVTRHSSLEPAPAKAGVTCHLSLVTLYFFFDEADVVVFQFGEDRQIEFGRSRNLNAGCTYGSV